MENLLRKNSSKVTYFVFLGFSSRFELQVLLFCALLLVYLLTVTGNSIIIAVTVANTSLHTPMYFFLRILSILDICFSSVATPEMLLNLLSEERRISYIGCAAQMYFLIFLGGAECMLLAVMAYDRYLAICNPLRYMFLMNQRVCLLLSLLSVVGGNLVSLVQTMWVFTLPFCGSNKIDYFFCDIPPLLKLSCTDTSIYEVQLLTATILVIFTPFVLILVSYILIISSILKMTSNEHKWKTFSTCSSHLLVVILYYGTSSLIYIKPQYIFSEDSAKMLALTYTAFTPMLNPVIYSIRNKEVQGALKKKLGEWKPPVFSTDGIYVILIMSLRTVNCVL
ncbi:olfactory receptor 10A7-like [Hemicordylus capensis]|uniref:olfactory receptor 10A7-like n=1 Tax=Hemicordylus capensis TaxID=884348 RepID=UPI002302CED7|nr:olfactory receptor 10A7-like [Hemicordylus capensis]